MAEEAEIFGGWVCTSRTVACIDVFLCGAWRPSVRAGLARALLRLGGEARPWPCPGADVRLGWAGWGGGWGMGLVGWYSRMVGRRESCGMFRAKGVEMRYGAFQIEYVFCTRFS